MQKSRACAHLAALLTIPTVAFCSTVNFSNHSTTCSGCNLAEYHADLNNDGREDLVTSEPYGHFSVQLTTGDAAYAAPVDYSIPLYNNGSDSVAAIALGDFNGDGSIDIGVFGFDSGNLYIYLNNGKGAFTVGSPISYAPSGGAINSFNATVGDFNRDNVSDLAFVVSGRLNVYFGNGKGGFTPGPSMGVNGTQVTMGDFDGDGLADICVSNDVTHYGTACVLFGDGTGHFPATTTLTLPQQAFTVWSAGDVNSDGKMDVMAVQPSSYPNRVLVFYGDGGRQLTSRATIPVGRCLTQNPAEVADLDGNGLNDLIVEEAACSDVNKTTLYVDVLTRNPNSSYNPDQTIYWAQPGIDGTVYEIPAPPLIVHADHNSKPDLLVQQCAAANCSAVYTTTQLNTTSGNFPACDAPPTAEGINVCTPPTDAAVNSPVRFQVGASVPVIMRDVNVWVDGKKLEEEIDGFSNYTYLDRSVSLTPGAHSVTVYAAGWDQSTVKKSFIVHVQ